MRKLYNGIEIPNEWPPKDIDLYSGKIIRVPYLENSIELIDVTVGRQLFVDNFLIEKMDGLESVIHIPKKYDEPLIVPETDGEKKFDMNFCGANSSGVHFDGKLTKMWYQGGWLNQLCYAESKDGFHFEKPKIKDGTNAVLKCDFSVFIKEGMRSQDLNEDQIKELREKIQKCASESDMLAIDEYIFRADSGTVIYDETSGGLPYKLFLRNPGGRYPALVMESSDGITWEKFNLTPSVDDRSTAFYNPFTKKWVYSIRKWFTDLDGPDGKKDIGRSRKYAEADEFLDAWDSKDEVMWYTADEEELPDDYLQIKPQIYNIDAVAYESLMVGMVISFKGPANEVCMNIGAPKISDLCVMFSRDGFHWSRPTRKPFIVASRNEQAWDRGYLSSVGNLFAVTDDELRIYYGAVKGDNTKTGDVWLGGMYSNGAIGVAILRRDGFVSLSGKGSVETKELIFTEKRDSLYVNYSGKITCEIFIDGKLYQKATAEGDSTKEKLPFSDLTELCGKKIKLKFIVDGELYSFWFADKNGKAFGYINGKKDN